MTAIKHIGAAALGTLCLAGAPAHAISVAGVSWDENSPFDFSIQGNQFNTLPLNAGGLFQGYGQITALNADSGFCAGCELTYVFSGYTLDASFSGAPNTPFTMSGGSLKIYVDTARDFSATNPGSAGNGQLWLELVGVDPNALGYTLVGSTSIPTFRGPAAFGASYMDIVGGLAQSYLDTNGQPGGSDFLFTTSFQPLRKSFVRSGITYTHFGTSEFSGVSAVPEAHTWAMMLVGLGLLGFVAKRRANASA